MDGERDKNIELEGLLKDARVRAAQSKLAALEEIHAAVHRHKKDAADQLDVLSVDTDPTRRAAG